MRCYGFLLNVSLLFLELIWWKTTTDFSLERSSLRLLHLEICYSLFSGDIIKTARSRESLYLSAMKPLWGKTRVFDFSEFLKNYKWLESYNSIFEKSSPGEVSGFSISRAWPAIHDTPDQCLSKYQNFKYWLAKMTKLGCQGNTKNSVQIMVTWKAAERFGFGSIIVGKTKSTKTACKRKTKTNQKKGKTTPPTPINDKKQGEFKIVLLQSETTDVIDDWY